MKLILDPTLYKISKLSFLSRILEIFVSTKLVSFIKNNTILEKINQSGFRSLHSNDTALVKVTNDLLVATDAGLNSIVIPLDTGSAFEKVDHNLLMNRLKNYVRISNVALY